MTDSRLRRELSKLDIQDRALDVVHLLDNIAVSQAIAVLAEARAIVEWTTTVDANGGIIRQERAALEERRAAHDASA